jgi:uncharacterized phage protein (TIGR02218 family)
MSILRDCSANLTAALADGRPLAKAGIVVFTLSDGTIYRWTSWDRDLVVDAQTYSSKKPWIKFGRWGLVNTMEVPTLTISLLALNADFGGGGNIKRQIHNGLFDGARMLYSRCYMPLTDPGNTTLYGTIEIFGGIVGAIDVTGAGADLVCKGGSNLLDQKAPRNVYAIGCIHTFCDINCTLNRATFTSAFAVGAVGITTVFIPWAVPPGDAVKYLQGTLVMTSGAATGQRRTILDADASGLTLAYPLYTAPAAADTFTAFKGCLKTKDMCEDDYANLQHFRGAPYIPPPNSTV